MCVKVKKNGKNFLFIQKRYTCWRLFHSNHARVLGKILFRSIKFPSFFSKSCVMGVKFPSFGCASKKKLLFSLVCHDFYASPIMRLTQFFNDNHVCNFFIQFSWTYHRVMYIMNLDVIAIRSVKSVLKRGFKILCLDLFLEQKGS